MYHVFSVIEKEPMCSYHEDLERAKEVAVELSIDLKEYGDIIEVWSDDYKETLLKISFSKYPLQLIKGA